MIAFLYQRSSIIEAPLATHRATRDAKSSYPDVKRRTPQARRDSLPMTIRGLCLPALRDRH
jgi:hypothetical protein